MSKSIPNVDWAHQLESAIRQFIKEKLELIMREEIKNFLEIEQAGTSNTRNGYYQRNLDTQYGRIEGLLVPRDRNGEFQIQLFAPYQRHTGWLEEAIINMYQNGMSTRESGKFIERILGNAYSPTTISHITDVVKEDIVKWHTRPLPKRYSVLYLDGLYVKIRRDTVEKEVIYVVLGVNEEGYREILDFFVGGQESAYGWQEILQQLYKRGGQEVLLGVFDGLPGLEEAFKAVYPKADVQRCVVHKVRNTLNRIRKKDQFEVAEDLKLIYRAPNKEFALQMFQQFESKWSSKYPREVQSWVNELDVLLTLMDYPSSIRSVIYMTNAIERTIKEIRKRLKPMNSLSSLEAAEKVVYLTIQAFNEKWAGRKLRGFAEAQEALQRMFEERYN
ncbi:IS256 family transposase [Parageobacillus thermoglucosidasius]|uniref:IS256 family transposase n=1 Tax=Parageobacillus thermoglucosidasius TaxID=1426 RepID=UPI000F626C0E|nr:IS256 family transposase [Parageobacillus thermoglucosidasius]GCD81392.1 IS256 family transposase [Parageobacillus thermoglucosidasius]